MAFTVDAAAQPADSLKATADSSAADSVAIDPTRYRLLTMATGEIMPKGSSAIGIHELLVLTVNSAPLDFLQIGGTFYLHLFDENRKQLFWNAYARASVFSSRGFVRGIAVGINAGTFWPLVEGRYNDIIPSYMVAGSFGSDDFQFHAALNGTFDTQRRGVDPFRPLQIGATIPVGNTGKLIVESWWIEIMEGGPAPEIWFAGFRNFSPGFVWEFGAIILPNINVSGHGPGTTFPFPYASISFCF